MMAGHLVTLAAFLVETDPCPETLCVNILAAHLHGRADTGEGIDEQRDEGAVTQAHELAGVDRVQQGARFFCGEHRRLAFLYYMLRPTNHARGVGGYDLAEDKLIEEHADGGELEFDGRRRDPLLQFFDIIRDVYGLHVSEMIEAVGLAPDGKFTSGLGLGFPGVGVSDVGGEELKNALRCRRVGSEEGGEWNARNYRRVISRLEDSGQKLGSHFFRRL